MFMFMFTLIPTMFGMICLDVQLSIITRCVGREEAHVIRLGPRLMKVPRTVSTPMLTDTVAHILLRL